MNVLEAILDLLFPPKCPFCRKVLDSAGICDACQKKLPWIEEDCVVRKGPGGLRCAAPLWYEGAVRDCLLRFKFQGASFLARPLGEIIARCAAEYFSGEFDMVTWVPSGKARLKKRGYNQAELLAGSACRLWGIEPAGLLERVADGGTQSAMHDAAARRANVLGVFEPVNTEMIHGARILLIDDICTTGATLTECIRVLKDAGASDVVCVTVAMTRERKSPEKERE